MILSQRFFQAICGYIGQKAESANIDAYHRFPRKLAHVYRGEERPVAPYGNERAAFPEKALFRSADIGISRQPVFQGPDGNTRAPLKRLTMPVSGKDGLDKVDF